MKVVIVEDWYGGEPNLAAVCIDMETALNLYPDTDRYAHVEYQVLEGKENETDHR